MELKTINIDTINVCGNASMALLKGFPDYMCDVAYTLLNMNGIHDLKPGISIKVTKIISLLDEIAKKFGDITLYEIGKAIPSCAILPDNIRDLKDAFQKIDMAFKMNHFDADICQSTLMEYNAGSRSAKLQITNPYPFEINRGIIAGISRKFEPKNAQKLPEVHFVEKSQIIFSENAKQCQIDVSW